MSGKYVIGFSSADSIITKINKIKSENPKLAKIMDDIEHDFKILEQQRMQLHDDIKKKLFTNEPLIEPIKKFEHTPFYKHFEYRKKGKHKK